MSKPLEHAVVITKTQDGGMRVALMLEADVVIPASCFRNPNELKRIMQANVVASLVCEKLVTDIESALLPAIDQEFRAAVMPRKAA